MNHTKKINFKTSPVLNIGKTQSLRHVLVFQAERGLFRPKQGGGDSDKTLSKLPNKNSTD